MDVLNNEKAFEDIPPKTNNPLAYKHDLNYTTESNIHIYTFNQSPFNTDDDIPLIFPKPLDWNQCGPPILDQFDDDDALEIDFEIYEGIEIGDHKKTIYPKVNTLEYFGSQLHLLVARKK